MFCLYRLTLLRKLLEDGQTLLKKGRLQEAAFRFQYASKKLPTYQPTPDGMSPQTARCFAAVHVNLVLGLSRCKRKLNVSEHFANAFVTQNGFNVVHVAKRSRAFLLLLVQEVDEALDLATRAVEMRPDSFEAFYARARVLNDMG
jgi:tetratricopeptide (TPR) repeat protein